MMRRLLPTILLLVLLIADTTLLPIFTRHWLMPIFSLITVNCFGLMYGRTRGLWYGLLGGLLMDISVGSPLGLWTITYVLYGYLGGLIARATNWSKLGPVISGGVSRLVLELMMLVFGFIVSVGLTTPPLKQIPARIALEMALAPIFFYIYNVLLRPSQSRFAARRK